MLTGWTDFEQSFGSIDELRRKMERFWEGMDRELARSLAVYPPSNLCDCGSSLYFEAMVPGCTEKDVEISVTQDGLTVSGKRMAEAPEGYSVLRKERRALEFSRSFELPCKIEVEGVEAKISDGILQITLPKAQEARAKRIEITGH